MLSNLQVLLRRYFVSYWRTPKRLLNDFLLALTTWIVSYVNLYDVFHIGTSNVFQDTIISGNLITIPFSCVVAVFLTIPDIVTEKNSGIKEFFKLNGVSTLAYQCYIIMVTFIRTAIFTLITVIIYGSFLKTKIDVSFHAYVIWYFICVFGTMSFVLLSSIFCSNPKTASITVGFLYFAVSEFLTLNYILDTAIPSIIEYLSCLSPLTFVSQNVFINQLSTLEYKPIITVCVIILFELALYLFVEQIIQNRINLIRLLSCSFRKNDHRNPHENLTGDEESRQQWIRDQNLNKTSAKHKEPIQGLDIIMEVINVSKSYGKFVAVDNVSFPLYRNNIFCLLGQNGAGKTTVIKMMLGLIGIDKGDIFFEGQNLTGHLKDIRPNIGVCTEQGVFFEKHRVREHLEVVAKFRKVPQEKVEEALVKLELINDKDKYIEELSGGSRRRLSIAMAILGNTKLLFLDEPTSGVDPQNRRAIWSLLKQLKNDGLTILMTTHHMEEADELSDQIGVMSKGQLLVYLTSKSLKTKFCGDSFHLDIIPDYTKISMDNFISLEGRFNETISEVIPKRKVEKRLIGEGFRCYLPSIPQQLIKELEKFEGVNLISGPNTLEDALMSNLLLKDQLQLEEIKQIITENSSDGVPECFLENQSYSFLNQTIALSKRRVYLLYRSKLTVLFIILPPLFLSFGRLNGFHTLNDMYILFQSFGSGLIGTCFGATAYCFFIVYEKQENLKHLMYSMGLRRTTYWTANIVVDTLSIILINTVAFLFLFVLFWLFYPYGVLNLFGFILVLISHGITLMALGYAYSFLFDNVSSVIKYFPLSYFVILLFIGEGMVYIRENTSYTSDFDILILLGGLINPTAFFAYYLTYLEVQTAFTENSLKFAGCQFVYAIFYLILTISMEILSQRYFNKGSVNQTNQEKLLQDPIVAVDLTKRYNGASDDAIKNINFNVKDGQIFSIIGPNGAGKSTLFNVLTAAIPKSSGSVRLKSIEIKKYDPEVFENVGVCPQFDGLWDDLTVKEHLSIFGTLKGLNRSNISKSIGYYVNALSLTEHAEKKVCELSKGNKRKLSVANAFIGLPGLIFLDEPSTGLDPFARISLRRAIQQLRSVRQQTSIFLSTHSISEAQSLSHKIGIISRGEFSEIRPSVQSKDQRAKEYNNSIQAEINLD